MKQLIIGFMALALIGAGCSTTSPFTDQTTQSDATWWLSFDLPQDWVVVNHYRAEDGDEVESDSIHVRTTDVVIQSTDLPIALEGEEASEEYSEVVTEDYTYIRAYRYTTLIGLPDDAVDLGNGFYSYEADGETRYWWPGEFGNYRFDIVQNGRDVEEAKEVIFSAQENDLSEQL